MNQLNLTVKRKIAIFFAVALIVTAGILASNPKLYRGFFEFEMIDPFIETSDEVYADFLPEIRIDSEHIWQLDLDFINNYLSNTPKVAQSIVWDTGTKKVRYADWNTTSETKHFRDLLTKFYEQVSQDKDFTFSYSPSNGPAITYHNDKWGSPLFTAKDAEELYLSRIALSIWIETTNKVPWKLSNYSPDELDVLFNASHMFEPVSKNGTQYYMMNVSLMGNGTPTAPYGEYRFMDKSGLIGKSQKETIMNLTKWIRKNLHHGHQGTKYTVRKACKYDGECTIKSMLTQNDFPYNGKSQVRFWAWTGCGSASALMNWTARSVNIPAYGRMFFTKPQAGHGAIDFPSEKLIAWHTDIFYADAFLLDPNLNIMSLYNGLSGNYQKHKAKYANVPANSTEGEKKEALYYRELAEIALKEKAFAYVFSYWNQKQDFQKFAKIELLPIHMNFTQKQVNALKTKYEQGLKDAISNWKNKNTALIDQEMKKRNYHPNDRDVLASTLYYEEYQKWKKSRY